MRHKVVPTLGLDSLVFMVTDVIPVGYSKHCQQDFEQQTDRQIKSKSLCKYGQGQMTRRLGGITAGFSLCNK